MTSVYNYYISMSVPARISTQAYLGSVLAYNFWSSYSNSKMYLDKFRAKKLTANENRDIQDEWSAVRYGASFKFIERFFDSFIWPITLTKDIVPWLVLTLNRLPEVEHNTTS